LRYRQYFASGIEDGAIHFAGFIRKDPQFNDLFCQSCGVLRGVAPFNAKQNENPCGN